MLMSNFNIKRNLTKYRCVDCRQKITYQIPRYCVFPLYTNTRIILILKKQKNRWKVTILLKCKSVSHTTFVKSCICHFNKNNNTNVSYLLPIHICLWQWQYVVLISIFIYVWNTILAIVFFSIIIVPQKT